MERQNVKNCKARGVSLPENVWRALHERARVEDLPMSRIVRRAVVRELARDEGRAAEEREAAQCAQ